MTKLIPSNFDEMLWTSAGFLVLLVVGYLERGFDKYWFYGLVVIAVYIAFLIIDHFRKYVSFSPDKRYVTIGLNQITGPIVIEIFSILKIARARTHRIKSFGSAALVFHRGDDKRVYMVPIREDRYSLASMKEIIATIKRIHPAVPLDEHYQDLLAGKDFPWPGFKKLPAVHTLPEAEAIAKQEFNITR